MRNFVNLATAALFSAVFFLSSFSAIAQTNKEEFLAKFENSKQFTLDVLAKMPESEMDYKTDPAAMSFKEQIHHIGEAVVEISKNFLKGAGNAPTIDVKTASKSDLDKYVAAAYDYGIATCKALSEEAAAEKIEVFGSTVSLRQVEALIIDHCTHHRGSAIAYLRAKGIEPPAFVGF